MPYDIFISYRRDNGEQSAKAIYDRLRDKGYHVFLDVETLRSGAFNEKLYTVIEECRDVLVILSPNALDRCVNEDDWVRLEVAHAIKRGKNVIPIMLRGFEFPEKLPEDLEPLRYQNGIPASVEFFDAFMDKLYRFLRSKPGVIRRFFTSLSWRRAWIAIGISLLLVSGIWGGSILVKEIVPSAYPVTQKQKNDVRNMLAYIQGNLGVADNVFATYLDALKACEDYGHVPSETAYRDLLAYLDHGRETLTKEIKQIKPLPPELSQTLSETKINLADLNALAQYPEIAVSQYEQTLTFMGKVMNPEQAFDDATRFRLIAINRDLVTVDAQSLVIGTCQLLLPVNEAALKEFRTELLPLLGVISKELSMWSRDETDLTGKEKMIATQQQKLMEELSSLVGKQRMELQSDRKALRELINTASKAGLSLNSPSKPTATGDPLAEKQREISRKQQEVDQKRQQLAETQKQLEEKKQELREKFTPTDTDGPYLVWGKALRFLKVYMVDDAISAFQFYLNKVKNTDPEAAIYVPAAIHFVRSMSKTGINYGMLVVGYEPGKPKHPVFRVGDILIAVNEAVCRNFGDYEKITKSIPANAPYQVTILRPDESGALRMIDAEIPRGVTKVAFMNLMEEE